MSDAQAAAEANDDVDADIKLMMQKGAFFYKHDFGRNKRSRKAVTLSSDCLSLKWTAAGKDQKEIAGTVAGSPQKRSSSFQRTTSILLSDVSHIIYGPYTDTFAKKTAHDRTDARWACFSLVLRESRTVDFAAEDEPSLLNWLLGLQQLIVFFSASGKAPKANERWTLPKLHLQKLRLKVSGESDKTGQGPYDVVLSAVLDVATELQVKSEKSTKLQAAWRRRNTQGKFQTAVSELMEINGLIEDIEQQEQELQPALERTAGILAEGFAAGQSSDKPPAPLSEKDSRNIEKTQAHMLAMGEYAARQQIKLEEQKATAQEYQALSARSHHLATEKRKLQNLSDKLQFQYPLSKYTLTQEEAKKVMDISATLGMTPRGTITDTNVRRVVLHKDTQSTRLGIIFHQNTPEELLKDTTVDANGNTPRASDQVFSFGGENNIVLPVIKVLDKSGIAGSCPNLHEGDQVISVNGMAALSNIQAVQMLREAQGEVVLAVRETIISRTPRGNNIAEIKPVTGLQPINK